MRHYSGLLVILTGLAGLAGAMDTGYGYFTSVVLVVIGITLAAENYITAGKAERGENIEEKSNSSTADSSRIMQQDKPCAGRTKPLWRAIFG